MSTFKERWQQNGALFQEVVGLLARDRVIWRTAAGGWIQTVRLPCLKTASEAQAAVDFVVVAVAVLLRSWWLLRLIWLCACFWGCGAAGGGAEVAACTEAELVLAAVVVPAEGLNVALRRFLLLGHLLFRLWRRLGRLLLRLWRSWWGCVRILLLLLRSCGYRIAQMHALCRLLLDFELLGQPIRCGLVGRLRWRLAVQQRLAGQRLVRTLDVPLLVFELARFLAARLCRERAAYQRSFGLVVPRSCCARNAACCSDCRASAAFLLSQGLVDGLCRQQLLGGELVQRQSRRLWPLVWLWTVRELHHRAFFSAIAASMACCLAAS